MCLKSKRAKPVPNTGLNMSPAAFHSKQNTRNPDMRHVYPTDEVPHLWAHQSQSDARNPQGNLFFRDSTIYSYRTSWPLARIYKHAKRGTLVLTNADKYSATTAGHQSAVNQACSHLSSAAVPQCVIGDGAHTEKQDHEINAAYFQREIARLLKESQRALSVRAVDWRVSASQRYCEDALDYSAFFGIRRKVPAFPADEFDAARERARRIETPDPVRDAAKIREREKRAALTLVKFEGRCRDWRLNAYTIDYRLTRAEREQWRVLPCMLRVSGDQIETSQGARIPLDHAPRIWALVQACRSSGRAYEKNGHTEHAGSYAIDSVSAAGDLKAGCHTIAFAEIERLAVQLGLAPLGIAHG